MFGSKIEFGFEPVKISKLSMKAWLLERFLVELVVGPGSCLISATLGSFDSLSDQMSSEASESTSFSISPLGSNTSKNVVFSASSDDDESTI